MPAKQMEDDQWHEQMPANPATQQMAEKYLKYPFSKQRKADAFLVQNIEKCFRLGFKNSGIDLIMPVKENRKNW